MSMENTNITLIKSYIVEKYKKVFQSDLIRPLQDEEVKGFLDKENWKDIVDYRINYMKENNWKMFIISDYFEKVKNSNTLGGLVMLPVIAIY